MDGVLFHYLSGLSWESARGACAEPLGHLMTKTMMPQNVNSGTHARHAEINVWFGYKSEGLI
jgi:hypothetical protein